MDGKVTKLPCGQGCLIRFSVGTMEVFLKKKSLHLGGQGKKQQIETWYTETHKITIGGGESVVKGTGKKIYPWVEKKKINLRT